MVSPPLRASCQESAGPWIRAEVPARAWIALGSNLGDRAGYLALAREALGRTPGIARVDAGVAEETPPLGGLDQPVYLNQMLLVHTDMAPHTLLHRCHEIERAAGRVRTSKWSSRTLDVDLVRFGDTLCDLPELTLPHPGLRERTFWAREIAALETHDGSPGHPA
jgi:2-amino-4-hydroxy-6-hydroxymethyldihydropteridine diphosphokinase